MDSDLKALLYSYLDRVNRKCTHVGEQEANSKYEYTLISPGTPFLVKQHMPGSSPGAVAAPSHIQQFSENFE